MARTTLASLGYEPTRVTVVLGPGQRQVVNTLADRFNTTPAVIVGCVSRYYLLAGALDDAALAAYIEGWTNPQPSKGHQEGPSGHGYAQLPLVTQDDSDPL